MKTQIGNEKNSYLSIVIPTYNRAEFLDRCLELLVPAARMHNIAIYISDNYSEDNTKAIVNKRIEGYPFIEYHCNQENLGADKNFELALKIPKTDYIWLLGDTYQIQSNGINFLIPIILDKKSKFDAIVVNVDNRVKDIGGRDYVEKNELLIDLGWHMTCMSSLIYGKHLLDSANFDRYRETYFIQTGIILEFIEDKEFLIKWESGNSVLPIILDGVKKNSWQNRTFEVWVEKWSNFVFSLPPSYNIETKLRCIKSHGLKSGMFSVKGLLSLRASGILNPMVFRKFMCLFPWTINSSVPVIFAISFLPKIIPKAMRYVFHKWAG